MKDTPFPIYLPQSDLDQLDALVAAQRPTISRSKFIGGLIIAALKRHSKCHAARSKGGVTDEHSAL